MFEVKFDNRLPITFYSEKLYVKLDTPCKIGNIIKDAMPVSFRSELFTSYILTVF